MRHFMFVLLVLNGLTSLSAQINLTPERFAFDTELDYNPAIASPARFLGRELGASFTEYAETLAYCNALDAASNRVALNEYGRTYEGRPLINLIITSETNHKRLEELRNRHLQLTDPSKLSKAAADELIAKEPVFISFSYNIHGNEASSTEAAMQVAYRLAAAQDEATQKLLEQAVIILYVCINPDGRSRYVSWYNGAKRNLIGVSPGEMEHYEPWPGGRTNHYWFDLNRDWVWGIHPEMRGLIAEYQKWMPQVHVDYHEQGYNSNYFTAPGTTPRNLLLPDRYEALSDTFGRANIKEFDRHQIDYFTRDAFDFFYPGYGSSYPSVMGGIGMLTEQGGIGAGLAVETEDGYVLLFRQRIFDHYITSLASIRKAVEKRAELLRYSYDAWQPSNSKSDTKAYILPADQGGYLFDVLQMLQRHNVKIEKAQADFTVAAARDFRSGQAQKKTFPKGTYLVSTQQPLHLFIHSVMERNMALEDSVMYDVATWSAPLAYNLEAFSSAQKLDVATKVLETAPTYDKKLNKADARFAFVIDGNQRFAPRALAMLWTKGYRVRAAIEPFSDDVRQFPAGSLIVLCGRNLEKSATISQDMQEIASTAQVVIDGYDTGRMKDGYDLASSRNRPLKAPKVAMLVEPPFDSYTAGQVYHLFDRETLWPVDRVRASVLRQSSLPKFGQRYGMVDLNKYDVLILPGGGGGLEKVFDKPQLEELRAWISAGGILIALEDAVPFFTAAKSKFTNIKLLETKKDSSEAALYLPFENREEFYGKKGIPGTALRAQVDISHPLAFGLKPEFYTLKFGSLALAPNPELQTVGFYHKKPESLWTAGYASNDNLKHLVGNTFAGVLPMGQGKIVFLLDNPQFRMFWRGPSRLMQNAVMFLAGQ